jgi:drug/metabolite transporter (DMT)-like permease
MITKETRLLILVNVALICAQIGFGGFSVVGKLALKEVRPIVFALYREVASGPILLLLAAIFERVKPQRQDWLRLFILGIVLYANQLCYIMGLKLTNSATQTAIMQQLIPVFTAVFTVILRMEKPSSLKFIGLVFAVAGAVVMIGFKDFSKQTNHTIGMLVLLCNGVLMSSYYILQKPMLAKYPPITVTGCVYMFASIAMGLTSLCYINEQGAYHIPNSAWWPLAYAVFIQTIFGYCCVSWANKYAPASLVAAYNCLQPIVAFVLAHIFFGEEFVWNDGVGMAAVVVGLAFVTWARMQESKEKEKAANEHVDVAVSYPQNSTVAINTEKSPLLQTNTYRQE